MKKLYTLIVFSLFLFAGEKSFSQTFSASMPDTVQPFAPSVDVEFLNDTLINNTSNAISLRVDRVQNLTPALLSAGWSSDFCLNVCYLTTTDSVSFTIPAHSNQNFLMHIGPGAAPASGSVLMEFRNTTNPSNKIYQRFYVNNGSAVHELNGQDVNVKIAPNPIVAGSSFAINISSIQNSAKVFSLTVYDMIGNAVANYSNLIAGNNSVTLNASQGIYFYKLVSENQQVGTGKLIITE